MTDKPKILFGVAPEYNGPQTVYKAVIFGPKKSGKKLLLQRIISKGYYPNLETYPTEAKIVDGASDLIIMIDTLETEEERKKLYQEADVFIFCFDLNDENSFNEMKALYEEKIKAFSDIKFQYKAKFLLGTKRDLECKVSEEKIDEFRKKYNLNVWKVSSVDGKGIDRAFSEILYFAKENREKSWRCICY